ncbi:MAG: hypothetical protein AAGF57_15845 [Pseudomonadota bacterium]
MISVFAATAGALCAILAVELIAALQALSNPSDIIPPLLTRQMRFDIVSRLLALLVALVRSVRQGAGMVEVACDIRIIRLHIVFVDSASINAQQLNVLRAGVFANGVSIAA